MGIKVIVSTLMLAFSCCHQNYQLLFPRPNCCLIVLTYLATHTDIGQLVTELGQADLALNSLGQPNDLMTQLSSDWLVIIFTYDLIHEYPRF